MRSPTAAFACSLTFFAVAVAVPAGLAGADQPRPAEACAAAPARDVPYESIEGVDPDLLALDVAPVAGTCTAPVAVWIHGGGWRRGDKSNDQAAREAFYNAQGWVLVSVNYRLSTDAADPPVIFPDHNNDVAAALAWIDVHVADYGGDPSRVMLIGHSAGAGIAAAITADPRYLAGHDLDPTWLDCVVLLDTAGYDVPDMAATIELYRNAFGDDPAVWADASPSEHVGEGPLPAATLIVTRGRAERVAKAQSFADQLTAAGADAPVVDVNPLTHGDVNTLIGAGDNVMTSLMVDELANCSAA